MQKSAFGLVQWLGLASMLGLVVACDGYGILGLALQAPTNFVVTANSSTSVRLSWDAVTGSAAYALERRTGNAAFTSLAAPTGTTFDDAGLVAQTTYTYRLKAKSLLGAFSDPVEKSVTTPAATPSSNLVGTVIVIDNNKYDFGTDTTTPGGVVASGRFVQLVGGSIPSDAFASVREKCFVTSTASGLPDALKFPNPSGTALEAGASIALKFSDSSAYGSLSKTAIGVYGPATALTQPVPATLKVAVPGAGGGFPAVNETISRSSLAAGLGTGGGQARILARGFSVAEPPTGTQGDLGGDIRRAWTKGPNPAAGSSSVVIMEFFGIEKRSDHVTCVVDDDGEFFFLASDPAYKTLAVNNTKLRFESSARAVARVQTVGAGNYLQTIVVERTEATPPTP